MYGRYMVVPDVVRELVGTAPAILWSMINRLHQKQAYCNASNDYLAEQLDVSVATIKRYLKVLKDAELIEIRMVTTTTGSMRHMRTCELTPWLKNEPTPRVKIEPLKSKSIKNKNTPICPQAESKEFKPYAQVLIAIVNEETGRKFSKLSKKARKQLRQRILDGCKSEDLRKVVRTAFSEMKERGTEKYLTPEFITREDEYLKYDAMSANSASSNDFYRGFKRSNT